MDEVSILASVPTPAWAALSAVTTGLTSWFLALRTLRAKTLSEHEQASAAQTTVENAERALFRTTLISDIAGLRLLIKECEIERSGLRARIVALEEQLLVQRASNEIMQRWISFFRSQGAPNLPDLPVSVTRPHGSGG